MVLGFIKRLVGVDEDLVKEGNELFNRGEYDKALAKYNEALEINKDNGDAKIGIDKIERIKSLKEEGRRLFNNGNNKLALKKFEEVLKLNPNDKEAKDKINEIKEKALKYYVELGDREFRNGNYENALKNYKKARFYKFF